MFIPLSQQKAVIDNISQQTGESPDVVIQNLIKKGNILEGLNGSAPTPTVTETPQPKQTTGQKMLSEVASPQEAATMNPLEIAGSIFKGVGGLAQRGSEKLVEGAGKTGTWLGTKIEEMKGTVTPEQAKQTYQEIVTDPEFFTADDQTRADVINMAASMFVPVGKIGQLGSIKKGATLAEKAAQFGKNAAVGAGLGVAQNIQTQGELPSVGQTLANAALGGVLPTKPGMRALSGGATGAVVGGTAGAAIGGATGGTEGAISGAKTGALLGGVAGAGLSLTKSAAGLIKPETVINSLIKPLLKDFSYGKNPGKTVAEMGITGTSLDDLAQNIGKARKEVGNEIGVMLAKPQNASKTLNLENAFEPLFDAYNKAAKTPNVNSSLLTRMNEVFDDVSSLSGGDWSNVPIQTAAKIKTIIGDITKFTGNVSDDAVVNKALKGMYGKIKESMNSAVKGLETLNEKYAGLTTAEIASKYRDKIDMRQNMIGGISKLAGIGGAATTIGGMFTGNPAMIASGLGALGISGLEHALSSTVFKTNLTKYLAKIDPNDAGLLFKQVPSLSATIKKSGKDLYEKLPQNIKDIMDNGTQSMSRQTPKAKTNTMPKNTMEPSVSQKPSKVKPLEKKDVKFESNQSFNQAGTAGVPKTLKQLEIENKSTFPKVPTNKVFLNNVDKIPVDISKKADAIIGTNKENSLPIEKISIQDIVPTQNNLNINNLSKVKGVTNAKESIVLGEKNGKYFIIDGHHRIANDILNGDGMIKAKVIK